MTFIFNPIPSMGQYFTLGAGPAQIIRQHVLPRLYGCRRLYDHLMLRREMPNFNNIFI